MLESLKRFLPDLKYNNFEAISISDITRSNILRNPLDHLTNLNSLFYFSSIFGLKFIVGAVMGRIFIKTAKTTSNQINHFLEGSFAEARFRG